jgi:hypothetical protein
MGFMEFMEFPNRARAVFCLSNNEMGARSVDTTLRSVKLYIEGSCVLGFDSV